MCTYNVLVGYKIRYIVLSGVVTMHLCTMWVILPCAVILTCCIATVPEHLCEQTVTCSTLNNTHVLGHLKIIYLDVMAFCTLRIVNLWSVIDELGKLVDFVLHIVFFITALEVGIGLKKIVSKHLLKKSFFICWLN